MPGRQGTLRLVNHVASGEHASSRSRDAGVESRSQEHRAWEVAAENRASASLSTFDARWVMAVRVAESLEGGRAAVLRPEMRSRLVNTATNMGLRPFDANLVIAIVQDAARCGRDPLDIDTAGQLSMVAPAAARRDRSHRVWLLAALGLGVVWAAALAWWLVS